MLTKTGTPTLCHRCGHLLVLWGGYVGGYSAYFWLHEELPRQTHEPEPWLPSWRR